MPNVQRSSILRAFFSLLALHTWFCGMFDPKTLHFMVTKEANELGLTVVTLFGVLGLLGFLDVVVNDFMCEDRSLPSLMEWRHLLFMGIAILNASEMFVAMKYVQSWGLTLYCSLVSTFVTITAFRDIQIRFSGPQKCASLNR